MTDDEADALVAAYQDLCTAISELDEADALVRTEDLIGRLRADDAVDVGIDLTEAYFEEPADDDDPDYVDALQGLLLTVLSRFGHAFDHPVFAPGLNQSALTALDEGDADTLLRDARRAAQLADDPDDLSVAHTCEAIALIRSDEGDAALDLLRTARREATSEFARLFAADFLIELLCDQGSEEATELAFVMLRECPPDADESWDSLGQAILRALILEGARWEASETPAPAELAAALRRCLAFPSWTPRDLTRADIATVVAWVDFGRDDVSLLEETMAIAGDGPFSIPDIEAQAALLAVMVGYTHHDVEEMERLLHQAAPAVTRSGAPGIVTAYRNLVDSVTAPLRGGGIRRAQAEYRDLRIAEGRPIDTAFELYGRAFDAAEDIVNGRSGHLPDDVRRDLALWRAGPHDEDEDIAAVLWVISAMDASFERDPECARAHLGHARRLRDRIPVGAAQRTWLDAMVDGLSAALDTMQSPQDGLARLAALYDEHAAQGREFLAFVTAVQLLIGHGAVGRAPDALAYAVKALAYLGRHRAGLAGSSERHDLNAHQEIVLAGALTAADRLGDPRVMAELLEYVRAQDLPLVHADPDPSHLPLVALLPPSAFGPSTLDPGRGTVGEVVDAVTLSEPRPVLMPWGRTALSEYLGEYRGEDLDAGAAAPVPLVVPRRRG